MALLLKRQEIRIAFLPPYRRSESVMPFLAYLSAGLVLTRQNEFSVKRVIGRYVLKSELMIIIKIKVV